MMMIDIVFVMCIRIWKWLRLLNSTATHSNIVRVTHMSQTGTTFHHATVILTSEWVEFNPPIRHNIGHFWGEPMSVCNFSHRRTCLRALCRPISISFVSSDMFPCKFLHYETCSRASLCIKRRVSAHVFWLTKTYLYLFHGELWPPMSTILSTVN